jgi:lipopolysaccharide export system protein LptA
MCAAPSATPKGSGRGSTHAQSSPAKGAKGAGDAKTNGEAKKGQTDLFSNDTQSKGPTEIMAKDEVQFDGQSRMAVFVGSVKVIDPQFTMTTDKLTVWMNKQEEGGGLREAEADGNVIIVHANAAKDSTKATAQGSASPGTTPDSTPVASPNASPQQLVLSTGRAQKAIYNAKEDAVTLIGWPQVTQGVNTHLSTEEGTRMILYRDGRLQTLGPSRTIIQDKGEMNKPAANAAASPNKPQNNNVLP